MNNFFATRLTGYILTAVAEHERELISASATTTTALAAAQARGDKPGTPARRAGNTEAFHLASAARTSQAARHVADLLP